MKTIVLHVLLPLFLCGSIITIAEKGDPNSIIGDLATILLVVYWIVVWFMTKTNSAEELRKQEVAELHRQEELHRTAPPQPPGPPPLR